MLAFIATLHQTAETEICRYDSPTFSTAFLELKDPPICFCEAGGWCLSGVWM